MKNLTITFLTLIALITSSCSSDDNNNLNQTYLNFKLNGEQIEMQDPSSYIISSTIISGGEAEGERTIFIYMPINLSVGTHAITQPTENFDTYNVSCGLTTSTGFQASSGTLTITSMNSEFITGTFSFTGQIGATLYNVTEGEFRVETPTSN